MLPICPTELTSHACFGRYALISAGPLSAERRLEHPKDRSPSGACHRTWAEGIAASCPPNLRGFSVAALVLRHCRAIRFETFVGIDHGQRGKLGGFTEGSFEPPSSSIRARASSSKRRSEGCLADFGTSADANDAVMELPEGSRRFILYPFLPSGVSSRAGVGRLNSHRDLVARLYQVGPRAIWSIRHTFS